MRKNPKLNSLICTAYDKAWRSIEQSERSHAPKLFAHVEHLVDSGHTDIEVITNHALGMLRGQRAPLKSERPRFRLAWLRRQPTHVARSP
jgi:hypothetical protein